MKIRPALPTDAQAIKSAHYHAYQHNYKGYLPDEFLKNMPFDKATIARTAEQIKNGEYYVALLANQVIGFAVLSYPEKQIVEIMALYVHPTFQKKGAGRALMNEICRLKKRIGYKKLVLWTIENGPSLGFYEKQGMIRSSDAPNKKFWKCDIPIIRLEKDL
ncbi:MAG: GNAT family N-acetyltransferase [Pseudomonadota bacterium]|nr:GNAT family N-acetyltransferase [Pseudomonadota bacterium]